MDDHSPSIVQNGTVAPGSWDRSFERSVLDQGVAYPADMAGLPTSTPNPGNLRRKSRRSWFETTPKGLKLEIAVEKPEAKKKPAPLSGSSEVLTLTHFTAAPRLDYGTLKPGQERVCTLLIRNPHDYEQKVKVEKVPEKKHFLVPCKEFVVGAGETYNFEITWAPVEAGNFREMLLMQVDSSYRVQAYVFGQVVAPPPKKKRVRKTGLLASRVAAPFSVIHTTSLANINHEYSPEKKSAPKPKTTRAQGISKTKKPEMKPAGQRRSSGRVRRSPRHSAGKQASVAQENKCVVVSTSDENLAPSVVTFCQNSTAVKDQDTEKPSVEEKIPKKKMRRSNTYSNVSGLGLTIPIIHGDSVKGHQNTSLLNLGECNVSGIKPLEDSVDSVQQCCTLSTESSSEKAVKGNTVVDDLPSFLAANNHLQQSVQSGPSEPSFLKLEDQIIQDVSQITGSKSSHPAGEPSFLGERNISQIVCAEPSFLSTTPDAQGDSGKTNARVAVLKSKDTSFHDSLEVISSAKTATNLEELPSFLADKENKPRRSGRKKSGKFETDDGLPSERKLLRSLKRRSNRRAVSPDSFIRETRSSTKITGDSSENNHKPLNDSIGQSSILDQLRSIKSFIHDKSAEIDKSGNESSLMEGANLVETEPEFKKTRSSPRLAAMNTEVNLRRGTFVTKPENIKQLEVQKPSEASPRRTTFTVLKKTERVKMPMRSRSEGSDCTTRSSVYAARQGKMELDTLDEGSSNIDEVVEAKIEQKIHVGSCAEAPVRELETNHERLHSVDSLENESTVGQPGISPVDSNFSFQEKFESAGEIPDEPNSEAFGRRTTLTVTKSRPSDALLEHTKKAGARSLFDTTQSTGQADKHMMTGIPEMAVNNTDHDNTSHRNSAQNSTFEVSKTNDSRESSFPCTPNQLPNSPDPDLSRRSTHVVEAPRVINLSRADRKQLFVPEKSVHISFEEEQEISETDDKIEKDQERDVKVEVSHDKDMIDAENKQAFNGDEQIANEESIDANENESPSLNTRRRLSARRSLGKIDKSKEETESESKDKDKGQLFFIALDESPEKAAPIKRTVRKNPQQFLKKRSNPVQQTEDAKVKRVRGEQPAERVRVEQAAAKDRADVARGKGRPAGRAIQSETINVTTAKVAGRVTRNAPKETAMGSKAVRAAVKPKANMVKGLAQSKLILVKKQKTALAKHPLPFAAKNMYYDERWMEKQERGFVNWLNFILTPADEYQGNNVKVKVDAGKLVVDEAKGKVKLAPTNEVLSFRAYSAHRKLNRLRKAACRLFQSDSVIKVIQKIESEVESGRLLVRKDKMLHADIGAKQKILDLLLSYNPLWLRVGLETIYGEVVPLQCNTDVYGLSRFVLTRMLYSPDIAAEYAHPTVPHLYRDGYAEATAQHTLKKFLMLVYFLERAKLERLIEHNPCLFCKNADAKTSKDLLLQISRDYLSGEGDITRHLGYLGYKVTYVQTALDEFDFAVSSLATDLRDGLRLSRVLELLCNKPDLSKVLRCPAISRLQKIHNVEAAFKVLTAQGINTDGVTARDIVDGHRERTLKLLWTIILQYQVQLLLDEAQLRHEIHVLETSLKLKSRLHALQNFNLDDRSRRESRGDSDLHTKNERLDLLLKWCRCVCAFYNIKIENFTVSFSDGRALCHILHYYHPGLLPLADIHDDTVMTHMEELERKGRRGRNLDLSSASLNDSLNSSAVFGDMEDPELLERLQKNERENFKVLFEKVKEVGGVPLMLKWSDMSGTIPDEKVVVTYLLYLCARLLDIRHESRAARTIQMAWRKHRLATMTQELKVKNKAASTIQGALRKFLSRRREVRRQAAAVCLQRVWRGHQGRQAARNRRTELALRKQQEVIVAVQSRVRCYLLRRRFLQTLAVIVRLQQRARAVQAARKQRRDFLATRQAACIIQASWKMYRQKWSYQEDRRCVVLAQSAVRRYVSVARYSKLRQAVVTVQHRFRRRREADQCRREFVKTRSLVVALQAVARGYLARKELKARHAAATLLQAGIRGQLERRRFERARQVIVVCQRMYRARLEMKRCRAEFVRVRQAAVCLQSAYRGHWVRKELRLRHDAATKIQALVRGRVQQRRYQKVKTAAVACQRRFRSTVVAQNRRQEFLIMKGAAITIQATYRAYRQQTHFKCTRSAAIKLQASIRSYLERKHYQTMRHAVVSCQRMYRRKRETENCRQQFLVTKGAAITLQAAVRGHTLRKEMRRRHTAATLIQAVVRMQQARRRFCQLRGTVVKVQRRWRLQQEGARCRRGYLATRAATLLLQATHRGHLARQLLKKQHAAATRIQAVVKGRRQRQQYLRLKSAAVSCQTRYRSRVLGEECRKRFLITKGAAITVQAVVRSYLVRRVFKQKLWSVTLLQAQIRGFLQRNRFQKLTRSAVVVQRRLRAKLLGENTRQQFLMTKGAAITLQAAFRSYKVRTVYKNQVKAVQTVQAQIRGYLQRKRYQKMRQAAIVIQKRFRAKREGEDARNQFLVQKGAAITLQAVYRGYTARKQYKHTLKSVTKVQALVRGYLMRRSFRKMRRAAIVIQNSYRAKLKGENVRKQFLIKKGAAITLQAVFRSYMVRKDFKHTLKGVTKVQALVRSYLLRKRFLNMKQAAIVIQRMYKAKTFGENVRSQFLLQKGAAITIQAAVRGYLARRAIERQHRAATVVQSHVRAFIHRCRYMKLRSAAVTCQQLYRCRCEARKHRQQYQHVRAATVTLQSAVRGFLARRELHCKNKAATQIQCHIRSFQERRNYLRLRNTCILCQRLVRNTMESRRCRREFLVAKGAAMTIQAAYRGYRVRAELGQQHAAAVRIQAGVRGWLAEQRYLRLRQAALLCQTWYRAHTHGNTCRQQYLQVRAAAITLQSAVRGLIVRKELGRQRTAATIIQSHVRGFLAKTSYHRLQQSVHVCQRRYRANVEGRKCREEFVVKKGAAITLQAAIRGHLARKQLAQRHQAATKIQALVRRYLHRMQYLIMRQAVIYCQTRYRNKLLDRRVRQQYVRTRQAVIRLQALCRGYRVRQEQSRCRQAAIVIQTCFRAQHIRTQYLRTKQATVTCQRLYRSKVEAVRCRNNFLICKGAAITLQACVKSFLVRQQLKKSHIAAKKVQALVRSHTARKNYLQLRQVAVTCQRRYRAKLEGQVCRQQFMKLKNAAVTIQAVYRGHIVRTEMSHKHRAATTIQARVKCHLQQQKYLQLKQTAVYCQQHYRAKLIGAKCRQEFIRTKSAAITLQAAVRGYQARKELKQSHTVATVIQRVVRGYQARKRYLALKWAAMVCQLRVRQKRRGQHVERFAHAARVNLAAVRLQRAYRNYHVRRLGQERLHSVLVIQSWMRSKLMRLAYLCDRQRVVAVQRVVRAWLGRRHAAARVIQRRARVWLGGREQRNQARAVTKIQAIWRGHCVRKNSKNKKVAAARMRVKRATASATDDRRLGNRTTSALDFLLKYKHLSQVFDALVNLELATRLSWVCCERLVETNAVAVLYRLVRGCNRSPHHMELIRYAVSVMLNLAKYEPTRPSLYEVEEGMTILVELMSIYREKKCPIFAKICNLLGIMALDDTCRTRILQDKKLREKLQSIHNLTVRKHKMEETQRVTRAKMNATMNGTFNATFLVRSPVKRHSIKPEWSLHRDRMCEIENPLKAVNFVLGVLGMGGPSGGR